MPGPSTQTRIMQIIDEVADERCERSMNAMIFLVEDHWSSEAVRLDGLPLEGHWSTIIIPVTPEQAMALAGSIYRQVKLTVCIDTEEKG